MRKSTRITETFEDLRASGRMAFMPFVTAGDPDLDTTIEVVSALSSHGVDLIEVGFPYSDPIADGPVIQASYQRALDADFTVDELFDKLALLDANTTAPLVAMVSYAIIFRRGTEAFVGRAREVGFSGLIVPDLPGDEAGEVAQVVRDGGLDLVQLVAPTTPVSRLEGILSSASGFLYCIAVAGTTGVRDAVPEQLTAQLTGLRSRTDLPLAVGFGISQPEHVSSLRGTADGAIVGSALVKRLEGIGDQDADRSAVLEDIGEWIGEMVAAAAGS
mgnify:CR=1 FL=1